MWAWGPILLQVPLPPGRAGGGDTPCCRQFGNPLRPGHAFFMEARDTDNGDRAECAFLQAVLQVAVPAGRFLCADEQSVTFRNEGGYAQVRFLRKVREGMQDGCGCNQKPRPHRMHTLRHVHPGLPHQGGQLLLRLR